MKHYAVVQRKTLQELVDEVEKMLNEGWLLVGGVSVAFSMTNLDGECVCFFIQALAKSSAIIGG